jgi:hypothetical protein
MSPSSDKNWKADASLIAGPAPHDRTLLRIRPAWTSGKCVEYRVSGASGDSGLSAVAASGPDPGDTNR